MPGRFLDQMVARWLVALVDAQGPGTDRDRVQDAADSFLAALVCDHASCDADA
jgi:hypothetical protein